MATYAEQIKTLKKKIANFDSTGGGKTSQKGKTLEQWKKELKRLQSLPETNKDQLSELRAEVARLEKGGSYKPTRTTNWMPGSGAHKNRVETLKNTISDLGGDLENEAIPEASVDGKPFRLPGEFPGTREEFNAKYNLSEQAEKRVRIPGEFPGTMEEFNAKYGTGGEVGEDPNFFQRLGGVDQGTWVNGQWQSALTDVDRASLAKINKARSNYYIEVNAAKEAKSLEQTGGQEYVTDYQTAIRNSRRDGLSFGEAEQYYGEDVLDSAGRRVRKSNVFTEDADGNPMGVKTRKQRLALDLARAEAAIPKPDKTDDLTTEQTGTVPNTAGTSTGTIESVPKQIPGSYFFPGHPDPNNPVYRKDGLA